MHLNQTGQGRIYCPIIAQNLIIYSDKQYIRQAVEKAARGTGGDTKGKKSRGEDPKRELKRRGKKMRRQEGDIR